jgi:Phytanoyl-CoA dioxygenase (PhyH)
VTSNDLLADRSALEARWVQHGYWYFRDVLDATALRHLRERCLQFLEQSHVASAGDPLARYNGGDLSGFDLNRFNSESPWKQLVAEPGVRNFFRTLTGEEPAWLPIGECRMAAPSQDSSRPRFDFIHTDGWSNPGLTFRTCWIPLTGIDAAVGGLALAEGLHRGPNLHTSAGTGIPVEAIPADRWRRADYRPGDLVMFDPGTPHTGLVNRSDRFRLSVDVRLLTDKNAVALSGTLVHIAPDQLTVSEGGREVSVAITERTLCRDALGRKLAGDAITAFFKRGDPVVVGVENGVATIVRHPK